MALLKRYWVRTGIAAACLLLFLYTLNMVAQKAVIRTGQQPQPTVSIGDTRVAVEIESTDAARELGLSGRASLAPGTGMLFQFDTDGLWGFWMKDMRFPIDIVWIDASGRIVMIARDVSPSTYPEVFYPRLPARMVLELPAGFASAHHAQEGDLLQIDTGSVRQ